MRLLANILILFLLTSPARSGTIVLEIRHLWEGEPLAIPSGELETFAGETVDFTRLSYLLSEPKLGTAPNRNQIAQKDDWFAFVDAENPVSRFTIEQIPDGNYTALNLKVGLNSQTDNSDPNLYGPTHPLNPLVNNLHWSPQGGYIFLALEGHSDPQSFSYHLGHPRNQVSFEIPLSLELNGAATVAIDFHLDRLFKGRHPLVTQDQTSTHSREGDSLAQLLKNQLPSVFSLREVRASDEPAITHDRTAEGEQHLVGTPYPFRLKKGFPIPQLPTDFPLTNERVALGEVLFHETQLSKNNAISCASCHDSAHAFSDPDRFSTGVEDRQGNRNSMPLFNLAWKSSFFWDGRAESLREQVLIPIQDHVEMDHDLESVVERLSSEEDYHSLFAEAFGTSEITPERISIALEQFLLSLTSFDSRFDRAARGEDTLTEEEKRGFELFMTEHDPRRGHFGADCFHCHGGALFTDHQFHNNGLEPGSDLGLEGATGKATDRFKFATPSLRNIALTAPYMHDGRFETLEEAVAHYLSDDIHRGPTLDPNLSKHPGSGIPLSESDAAALVAFLKTLTDEQYLNPQSPLELSRK